MTTAGPPRLVVLFDRDCGLCQATARVLRRWDRLGRLELVPLQAVAGWSARSLAETLHVVDEATGRVTRGGDAALAIAAALPGGRIVRLLRLAGPFRWVVGRAYDLVARNRRAIGRGLGLEGPACGTPR